MPAVALAELPRSLEDVYLGIVADERTERGVWGEGGAGQAPASTGDEQPPERPASASPTLPLVGEEVRR